MSETLHQKVNKAIDDLRIIADRNMIKYANKYPYMYKEGLYCYGESIEADISRKDINPYAGLWSGIYWNLYSYTGDMRYRFYANAISEVIEAYIQNINMNTSDVGQVILPAMSYKCKYLKSKNARNAIMVAADSLLTNYLPSFECISVWADNVEYDKFNIKIDDIINIMLLRWAYKEHSKHDILNVIDKCIDKILKYIITDEDDVYFRYYFNTTTGAPIGGYYSLIDYEYKDVKKYPLPISYALFGLALNYSVSEDGKYLDVFMRLAKQFFDTYGVEGCYYHINGKSSRDTASTLIAICAVFELKDTLVGTDVVLDGYYRKALAMLEYIIDNNRPALDSYSESFITGSVWYYYDITPDTSTITADYFYLEALLRYLDKYTGFWY